MTSLSGIGILFLLVTIPAILVMPRRWAVVPLLVGACYMTLSQGIQVGPLHFFAIRLIIFAGIVRVFVRGERLGNGLQAPDKLVIAWAIWAVVGSLFRENSTDVLINHLGLVFNTCGSYFLLRIFCQSDDDLLRLLRATIFLLVPVAIEMVMEQLTVYNMFSILGGISDTPSIRQGSIRAQGPFAPADRGPGAGRRRAGTGPPGPARACRCVRRHGSG